MNRCKGIISSKQSKKYGDQCYMYAHDGYCEVHKYQENNDKFVVEIIKYYINKNENVNGKSKKINIVKNIFMFLENNLWFLEKNKNFSDTTLKKLEEFEKDWNEATIYKNKLFGDK